MSFSDYIFNSGARLGSDTCCTDQSTIQNLQACNYTLQNFRLADGNMTQARALAVGQPGLNYSGGYGLAADASNVDNSSEMYIGTTQTRPGTSSIDLLHRPFATVPFLGRGAVDPVVESQIMQGESITSRRTTTKLGEHMHADHGIAPLVPEMAPNTQNPHRMIESLAYAGWVRGGASTRATPGDCSRNS
jgi:hypothetical protein